MTSYSNKRSIFQEGITIVNIYAYAPIRALKYKKQTLKRTEGRR